MNRSELETLADLVAKKVTSDIQATSTLGRWMTLKEAMKYCKVKHPDTIRTWITRGFIYGHKRTGQWIIDRESIDDWFSSEKVAC